jgi:uncharacterized protein
MRIEVGRGLEGVLTDATCGRIIRDVITPRFRRGELAEGLRLGVEALQHAAGGDFAPLDTYAQARRGSGIGFLPGGLIFLFIIIGLLRAARRNRYGGWGGSSVWPWLLMADSMGRSSRGGWGGGSSGGGGGGFSGFGGGGGFSGGGASGSW